MTHLHQHSLQFDHAPPRAACLVESLRAFGYELPTAIADLLDNSISAKARHVWIDFHWQGAESAIAVTDDGDGMTEATLVAAMRPGSQSPLQERKPGDLGRFGLGLKTASFSQCRELTVRSHTGESPLSTRRWDLDHVAEVDDWQLLRGSDPDADRHFDRLDALRSGTCVVWRKLDRLVAGLQTDNDAHHQQFLGHIDEVEVHLSMVFHRFLRGPSAVRILINGNQIRAWDPFLPTHDATQLLTATRPKGGVEIQPYILPHHSKLSREEFQAAAGPRGWNAHQGFYIYRNKRLLVAGDWLGLGWKKEEHYKLARIQIDIPNSTDQEWAIDVTKSKARPPAALKSVLRQIGERARGEAKRIYSHRGARLVTTPGSERVHPWIPMASHGKTFYRLNPEHPLLKQALALCDDPKPLRALVRLIEETVPVPHIAIAHSEEPLSLPQPFERAPDADIHRVMEATFLALLAQGYGRTEAVRRLQDITPFDMFPALLQTFAEGPEHA